MWTIFDWFGIKLTQEFINITIIPPCIAIAVFGVWSMLASREQFKEARERGKFFDGIAFTAGIGGFLAVGMALFYFLTWCVWR